MRSIGPAPLNPRDYVAELRAQHEITELFDAASTVVTTADKGLRRLSEWVQAQGQRLDDEEKRCHAALRELDERGDHPGDKIREKKIADQKALIERERAEIDRRRESGEATFLLQLVEQLGIDRTLVPGLARRRGNLVPDFYKSRVKIAVALSVMMAHGWPENEAARQIAQDMKRLGLRLEQTYSSTKSERKRQLTIIEQIVQCRRDVKIGSYKRNAEQTQPQTWRAAFEALTAPPARQTDSDTQDEGSPASPRSRWIEDTHGLNPLPNSADSAQRYCDRLLNLAEWGYAARWGDGVGAREAAHEAALFALQFDHA